MTESEQTQFLRGFAQAAHSFSRFEAKPIPIGQDTVLHPSQSIYLTTVESLAPVGVTDIATNLSVRKPSASQALSRLEEMGLVYRTESPADRRASLFSLTDQGRKACSEMSVRHTEMIRGFQELIDKLDPQALATCNRVHLMLYQYFDQGDQSDSEVPLHP